MIRRATSICASNSASAVGEPQPIRHLHRVQGVALLHSELHQELLGEDHPDRIADAGQL